jgi:hypothetical protein
MRTLWLASATKRGLSLFLVVLALALPMLAQPTGALAQAPADVVWDRYDVTIDVRSDGSMHITEHQVITFNGQFSQGFADIPLSNVEDIENISVSVANGTDDDPVPLDYIRGSSYDAETGTYSYRIESGALAVDYAFDPTDYFDAETRVVVLEYDVIGGLRVYEDLDPANQQVWWYAITSDVTDVAPVTASTVTINLPETVPVDQTVAYPDNPETDGQSFTWQRSNLGEGDEFEVSLQFPPITTAVEPDWQLRDDEIRQSRIEAQERSDFAGVLLLVAGLLTTFGGGIAIFALWFARGRDPQVGLVAEYLPEPPDDLRPGAVGVLLDESFQSRDVVATVLDLARRGVIRMDPVEGKDITQQYKFVLLDHKETLRQYELIVLDVIFGSGANAGAEALMPQVAGALAGRNDEIAAGFYLELVDHKYFRESPEATRKRWRRIYKIVPFAIAAVVIAIVAAVGAWSNFAFFPIVIGLVLMLVAGRVSNAMPQKSMAGAESAAKWRAFQTYLRQIDERKDIAESKEIFEKYLPYAVALGLAEEWAQRFAPRVVATPDWYGGAGPLLGPGRTVIIGNGGTGSRRRGGSWTAIPNQPGGSFGGSQGQPGDGGGGFDMPGMQDISDSASGGLQGGSDSFFDMLGNVAKAFAESSGSGSGSFGSGGGFGGFSGGGSRGGGSRSGGGGGGGRRGFK